MPETGLTTEVAEGKVMVLLKRHDDSTTFGVRLGDELDEYLYTWEDRRGGVWEEPQVGDIVRLGWLWAKNKKGEDKRYVQTIKLLAEGKDTTTVSEPASDPPRTADSRESHIGRQVAVYASATVLAAYIGNHAGAEWEDLLLKMDDLLGKYGAFID